MAQSIHAFSFGLFHMIAMRVIFQNFSAGQQGRGQALYSTMWGIGVASGSILAGQYWDQFAGATIFIYAAAATLTGLLFLSGLPNQVEPTKST
jgi:PPP family 3-phenylpropionic acid transporter